jgi:hypothetical protein
LQAETHVARIAVKVDEGRCVVAIGLEPVIESNRETETETERRGQSKGVEGRSARQHATRQPCHIHLPHVN